MSEWFQIINNRKKYLGLREFSVSSASKEQNTSTVQLDKEVNHNSINCPNCNKKFNYLQLIKNNKVCNHCNYHFRMNAVERINLIFDKKELVLFDEDIISRNLIGFPGYDNKLKKLKEELDINEAVITGKGKILDNEVYFGVMDYRFIMGSMGAAVGERLTRMIERATKEDKPIVIFSASGGARMQEGIISLYQMAKVVSAIEDHNRKGLMYISILTDPTTGGVMASFASIADVIIAEPNATIGFAGKRVSKNFNNTISDFQTSEFHLESGHVDILCERRKLRNTIADIIEVYIESVRDNKSKLTVEVSEDKNISNNALINISAWERVKLARSPNRPNFEDYKNNIFDNFIELHGDRISMDDKSIVTGIGTVNGIPVTAILSAKGKNLDENIIRNFGMIKPEGYRKVIRVAKLSEKFGIPVVCFIDTPGADGGIEAEKMGQASAIANCIKEFTKLAVPIISIITGEGGSGGALAIGVADWMFMLENSIYSIISPEGCASILFRDSSRAKEIAEYLKLTADELLKLNIVNEIIAERKSGINIEKEVLINDIKTKLFNKVVELLQSDINTLLTKRLENLRKKGILI
ncbi:acetyl-CoA carboxylase carboxyl transferase subunit beta [Clostridium cavendishii DSM 21758]|uniref:Multifunctional fusion protein n=1 Tax=Clostridium cavendishii DSM 21758 TaxID=1121302 RepID=A0A1M6MUK0_9CLOT|nr:acetyl-CoA carboxylase carboxyltransferase subunit alpha/beta [Clostridium cavendishii]SHJ87102.1 acetyl-CoA carboxylase carboxyl transferase subunit beta [Clostridium cavendishii DSM 21758]